MSEPQFVLLWSKAKNAIDIRPVEAWLSANRQAYKDDRVTEDWIAVYLGARGLVAACAGHCSVTLLNRELDARDPLGPACQKQPARAHLTEAA